MKISIIVPVYNTEKYLHKCIDSILNQTFEDFELILVDDGSTDSSGAICDEYAKKDERIVVIHKENGGVSKARNVALDTAKGEYIGFVDSDDTINERMLEVLYNNLIESNAQVSVCGFDYVVEGRQSSFKKHKNKKRVFKSKKAIKIVMRGKPFAGHLCNKLFKADLFEKVRLNEKIYIYEDMLAVVELLARADSVVYDSTPLYNYFLHSASACHSGLNERYITANDACLKIKDFLLRNNYKNMKSWAATKIIKCNLDILSKMANDKESQNRYLNFVKANIKQYINFSSFSKLDMKSKIKAIIASINEKWYFKFIRGMK